MKLQNRVKDLERDKARLMRELEAKDNRSSQIEEEGEVSDRVVHDAIKVGRQRTGRVRYVIVVTIVVAHCCDYCCSPYRYVKSREFLQGFYFVAKPSPSLPSILS